MHLAGELRIADNRQRSLRVSLCRIGGGADTRSEPEPRRQSREDSPLFFLKKPGNVPRFPRKNKILRYELSEFGSNCGERNDLNFLELLSVAPSFLIVLSSFVNVSVNFVTFYVFENF